MRYEVVIPGDGKGQCFQFSRPGQDCGFVVVVVVVDDADFHAVFLPPPGIYVTTSGTRRPIMIIILVEPIIVRGGHLRSSQVNIINITIIICGFLSANP